MIMEILVIKPSCWQMHEYTYTNQLMEMVKNLAKQSVPQISLKEKNLDQLSDVLLHTRFGQLIENTINHEAADQLNSRKTVC